MRGIKTAGRVERRGHELDGETKTKGKMYNHVLIKGKINYTKIEGKTVKEHVIYF